MENLDDDSVRRKGSTVVAERQYKFSWDFIGDTAQGRPNLGNMTRIEVYRLFQYTLRDVLEQSYGTEEADRLLYRAGFLAGTELCEKFVGRCESLSEFVKKVEDLLIELKIGVLRIEERSFLLLHKQRNLQDVLPHFTWQQTFLNKVLKCWS